MDFYTIKEREGEGKKTGELEVYPDFTVRPSKDLMIRGKQFYAIWDEKAQLWSTNEYDVPRLVDEDLQAYQPKAQNVIRVSRKFMSNFSSKTWMQFRIFVNHLSDSYHEVDAKITFANQEVKKEDYVSRRLPYSPVEGPINAYNELFSFLYSPEELAKLEWAVGSILTGDSRHIQKLLVLYGAPGTGKGTFLDLLMQLVDGYWATFNVKELTATSNVFAMDTFRSNPLVAIDSDGDLSKIADNSKLNAIVSHENMQMNEKNKPSYNVRLQSMIFVGSNKPVRFTDGKSGMLRRLIDVQPTGQKLPPRKYQTLVSQMQFELGAIAQHCIDVYRSMGKDYYSGYQATEMMLETDIFFNYIEAYFDVFREQDGTTLRQAYDLYKEFVKETNIDWVLPQYKFREELKNYFSNFEDRAEVDGVRVRSWYSQFNADRFKQKAPEEKMFSLVMEETESLLDPMLKDCPAQYANGLGNPKLYWTNEVREKDGQEFTPRPDQVNTQTLKDIDTKQLHYVKVPLNHIVIDFDLKDSDGNKSAERNLEAASSWPSTYAEFSQGRAGIHLHYLYEGDPTQLSRIYDDGIEVKVFDGNSALRRRLSSCNNIPVATISSGLPIKEKKVMTEQTIKSEKALRDLIDKNLRKEIHPGTKPSMDFIHHILEEAYKDGLQYDVTDLRGKLITFAGMSSNNALYCLKLVQTMKFASEEKIEAKKAVPKDERLVLFDVEVFPNLFLVCWKYKGSPQVVRMINPSPQEVEELFSLKLVGFNNRRYDNHILYARHLGFSNEELYRLSKKIIEGKGGMFGEAYNLSWTDIYDFSNTKKSLKLWEVELDLRHIENEHDWDKPVPEEKWREIEDYCVNDVIASEAVLDHLKADYIARQLLADLSGLPLNSTTQQHASKIVFGDDSHPQENFVYTDLSRDFPGYKYEAGKSTYRDEVTGEGGYVYSEPGIYENVAELDVESMHPTSIEALNLFGEYTRKFSDLKAARLAIKHRDFAVARDLLGGKLAKYLADESDAERLSYALKIVINIVYGLTAARFDNSFKDPKNIDNIVAKRGALFMIDLKHAVKEKGFDAIHIKTDSIKIPNATPEIIEFVKEFGKKYGYTFALDHWYDKIALVNDAVYIAKERDAGWTATGAQFAHPYVFKTLFSHEKVVFKDLCETKSVTTALYLDFFGSPEDSPMAFVEGELVFVGKVGQFCPIQPGRGGAKLLREKEGKFYAATGSKGYEWLESNMVKEFKLEKDIDMRYFDNLANAAVETISQFGDFTEFAS